MRVTNGSVWLELTRDLVDEVLMAAARSADPTLRQQFLDEREDIVSIEIVDIREERFRELDKQWASRFRISESLLTVLRQTPTLHERISGCIVDRIGVGMDETVALQDGGEEELPVLSLRVRAESLLSPERLTELVQLVL